MSDAPAGPAARLRRRVYEVLEVGRGDDRLSRLIDTGLIVLITLNVVAVVLETVPSVLERYGRALFWFEVISVVIFTAEYAARLWSCVEIPFLKRSGAWRGRLRFAMRPSMIIDLLAILPAYLALFISADLRVLRVLRLLRFFKLARYSPALHALLNVVVNERRALAGSFLLMGIMLLLAASGIYALEREVQPEAFGSIPQAAWWAMATLTTVGYGDVAPITAGGKMFGAVVMLVGLGMFALPIAIISTGFAQEVARRDFIVTWPLIARIPLLAELDAAEVAVLAPHLRAHQFPAGWAIVTPERPPDAIYFIASGSARWTHGGDERRLGKGDFFGAVGGMAMSDPGVVVTVSPLRTIELAWEDFHRLEAANPAAAARIRAAAAEALP